MSEGSPIVRQAVDALLRVQQAIERFEQPVPRDKQALFDALVERRDALIEAARGDPAMPAEFRRSARSRRPEVDPVEA